MTEVAIDAPEGAFREQPVILATTALLSIDMQNAEWSQALLAEARAPGSPTAGKLAFLERLERAVIPNIARLQRAARAAGVEVMFATIESLTRDGRDRSLDHKISRLHVPKGCHGGRVIDGIGPEGDEIHLRKTASGVFNSTNVDYVLRNLGITHLVIYGIMTDQCVETAIRDAADRGYLVTQVEDACAALEPARHDRSIEALRGHYCRTRTTGELVAELAALAANG